jgi:DNA-binding NarL/FixJ family response regulator
VHENLPPLIRRTRPDVVLLDCHPPKVFGLRACRVIKGLVPAPRVLIYSAYADDRLQVAARVAGADGLLNKNASARDLVAAVRTIHSGRLLFDPVGADDKRTVLQWVDRRQRQLLELLLDGKPLPVIAATLATHAANVERDVRGLLDLLCAEPQRRPRAPGGRDSQS